MADFKAPAGAKVKGKDRVEGREGVQARFVGRPKSDWHGADVAGRIVGSDEREQATVFEAEDGGQYRIDNRDGYFTDLKGPALPGGVPTSEHWDGATGEADEDAGRPDDHMYGLEPGGEGGVVGSVPGEPGDNAGRLPETRPDLQHQRSADRPRPAKFHESGYVGDQPRAEVADVKDIADQDIGEAEGLVAAKHAAQESVKDEPATDRVDRSPEDRGYKGLPVGEGEVTNEPSAQTDAEADRVAAAKPSRNSRKAKK